MDQTPLYRKLHTMSLYRKDGFIGKHRLAFLNIAQFLAALNDNLFKYLTIYLMIDQQGTASSNDVVFMAGVFYVLPFLLFSNLAGALSDYFSKQKIIVLMKAFEVLIILSSFPMFYYKYSWGCYGCVFLLSLQSALMSPAKYSIIPELVKHQQIPKANGLITSFTYLAVIFGTFLSSSITQITGRRFTVALVSCLLTAIAGFVASLYIPHTKANKSKEKFSPIFISQVIDTLSYCRRTPGLLLSVLGTAFFLFIGAFLQLSMVPYAIESLGISEVGGGYLFLATAVGIAAGATLGARACKREVNLGLSLFALFLLGVTIICLPFFSSSLSMTVLMLGLIGVFGGLFEVPLESYTQAFSPTEVRGKIIAAANFLSFLGVLLAPVCLLIFGKMLALSAGSAMALMGILVVAVFSWMALHLTAPFVSYFSKNFIQPFYDLHYIDYPFGAKHQEEKVAIIAKKMPLRVLSLILGETSKVHIFIVREQRASWHRWVEKFSGVDFLYTNDLVTLNPGLIKQKIRGLATSVRPLFLFPSSKALHYFCNIGYFSKLQKEHHYHLYYLSLKNVCRFRSWRSPLKRIQMTFSFREATPLLEHPKGQKKGSLVSL